MVSLYHLAQRLMYFPEGHPAKRRRTCLNWRYWEYEEGNTEKGDHPCLGQDIELIEGVQKRNFKRMPYMSATDKLISFTQELDCARVSDLLFQQARRCVLDLLGAAIAGSRTLMAQLSAQFAFGQFNTGDATVVGFSRKLSPSGATWVNGASASALDLDDGHRPAMGHPGASVIPAALSVAETVNASGEDLLTAIVAGYEVAVRASISRTPTFKKGFYCTGIWGAFGAVTAAAKLLRLDASSFQHAIGITLAHAPFPGGGGMAKEGIGWAGMVGCAAAFLAQQGFEGAKDAFDRPGRYDTDQLVEGLGQEYAILKTYFKPHASCRWSHPAIDGVLELVSRHRLKPQEIESVWVEAFYEATRLDRPVPDTAIAAQFSIPFCIALALLYGRVGLAEMTEANLHNPEVLRLARKVKITINPEYDRQFPEKTVSKVTLYTSSGSFTTTVEFPKGNPENPLSDAELLEKFRALSTDVITQDQIAALEEAVDRLTHLPNVRELTRLLTV